MARRRVRPVYLALLHVLQVARKKPVPAEYEERIAKTIGSNEWAIGPSKTKSKKAMLFINPHQPWYGYGQFYEAHVESGEGLHFSGSCFFGSPS